MISPDFYRNFRNSIDFNGFCSFSYLATPLKEALVSAGSRELPVANVCIPGKKPFRMEFSKDFTVSHV